VWSFWYSALAGPVEWLRQTPVFLDGARRLGGASLADDAGMLRVQSAVEKASTLKLVRERIELLRFQSEIERLKGEARLASRDVDLQRLLLAEHRAVQTRVAQFDTDNPEIADLFVFQRKPAAEPVRPA
jgi:hypothetical protein